MNIKIEKSWKIALADEYKKDYFAKLLDFIDTEYKENTIFPPYKNIFYAFDVCSVSSVKVVILGQDPYHGINQAYGLSFSVKSNLKIPPSLKNIYKEIKSDIGYSSQTNGDLTRWANQGVLLLNSILTVKRGKPMSHQGVGWEKFTNEVIAYLSDEKENIIFILWGKYAQKKGEIIDSKKHLVLTASHPSPFSARDGFFGCKHFSKTNKYLKKHNKKQIEW